jgi:uncharacterized protein (TIGR03067 family)
MRKQLFTVVPLMLALTCVIAADDASEEVASNLAGDWSADYKPPIPPGLAPKLPEGNPYAWCSIKADGTAKVDGFDNEAKLKFNPAKKPGTVDIEYTGGPLKGKSQFGIYEFKKGKKKDLDTWILVVADLDTKQADRPKDITKASAKETRYIFGRSYGRVIE